LYKVRIYNADSSSNESYDSKDSNDLDTESILSYADSIHAEPEQRPKWAKTTLQYAGYLVGDPVDTRRTQYDFEKPPITLTATELMPPRHIFLV
jgi:hypothetical protein